MRLLKRSPTGHVELTLFDDDDPPRYAILSHTWSDGNEVTYNELLDGNGKEKTGFAKIIFCMDKAAGDNIEYSWVDTCCIDKSTSDELGTAVNSMFKWYKRAVKCYVHLSDVHVPDEVTDTEKYRITWEEAFRRSRWFTRGWTLQELLAPSVVEFFSMEGKRLGSKISLEQEIHTITSIAIQALRGQSLFEFDIEERMRWAVERKTTRKEDKAYCLWGLFGIFLPTLYGEGEEHAMLRLREEIAKRQTHQDALNMRIIHDISSLPHSKDELLLAGRLRKLAVKADDILDRVTGDISFSALKRERSGTMSERFTPERPVCITSTRELLDANVSKEDNVKRSISFGSEPTLGSKKYVLYNLGECRSN